MIIILDTVKNINKNTKELKSRLVKIHVDLNVFTIGLIRSN